MKPVHLTIAAMIVGLLHSGLCVAGPDEPPPPPTPPWFVDAWIGFEGRTSGDPSGFFFQHALQFEKNRLVLTKMTVSCQAGRLYSTEGDGVIVFYEAFLHKGQQEGDVVLRYVGCERCIEEVHGRQWRQTLSQQRISETRVRLGEIIYDRDLSPYPEHCPELSR